ncbi:type II toxin-antitoxin system RelE/ParE family toxin [Patescibacteria group bacterium]|nr:type II toxin-antitoxin system RelE/ParE family toxin [Patescibacteria group bacterium]
MSKPFDTVFSGDFIKILKKLKKKDSVLYNRIKEKLVDIANNPYFGKPLGNVLKNRRRVHIGHFVLVYRINEEEREVRFLDFDHHDKVYKK